MNPNLNKLQEYEEVILPTMAKKAAAAIKEMLKRDARVVTSSELLPLMIEAEGKWRCHDDA